MGRTVNLAEGHFTGEERSDLVEGGDELLAVAAPRGVEFEEPKTVGRIGEMIVKVVAGKINDGGMGLSDFGRRRRRRRCRRGRADARQAEREQTEGKASAQEVGGGRHRAVNFIRIELLCLARVTRVLVPSRLVGAEQCHGHGRSCGMVSVVWYLEIYRCGPGRPIIKRPFRRGTNAMRAH